MRARLRVLLLHLMPQPVSLGLASRETMAMMDCMHGMTMCLSGECQACSISHLRDQYPPLCSDCSVSPSACAMEQNAHCRFAFCYSVTWPTVCSYRSWDLRAQKCALEMRGFELGVQCLATSPDAHRCISGQDASMG
jgi:hypothetical protein